MGRMVGCGRLVPRFVLGQATLLVYVVVLVGELDTAFVGLTAPGSKTNTQDEVTFFKTHNRSDRDISRKVVVTSILEPPYMMFKEHAMGSFLVGNERFEGYMADMLSHLAVAIGFEYAIRLSLDGIYGMPDSAGNWNGMIGELQRGEADIAVGPLTKTDERETVIDFTEPFMTFRSTAILKKPTLAPNGNHQQEYGRIKTAEQLMQSDVRYGVINGGITEVLIRTSETALYRNMWSRMQNFWPPVFVQNTEAGVARSRVENYAFILDAPMAEYKLGQEPCDLYSIEPFLDRRSYGLAMRKGDRLKNVINAEIRRMQRNQILQSLYLKWWASACTPQSDFMGDVQYEDRIAASSPHPARGHSTASFRSSACTIHHGSQVVFSLVYVITCLLRDKWLFNYCS